MSDRQSQPARGGSPWRGRLTVLIILVFVIAVIVLMFLAVRGPSSEAARSPEARSLDDRASERSLTILHTNDLHARLLPDGKGRGGFAEIATLLRENCAQVEACLVLDGGDMVQGTPVSTLFEGVPIYEVANYLGIDATTLGNHEFDYGAGKIAQYVETAEFPLLNANVTHPGGGRLGDAATLVLETDNGIRVGIIGVVTESLPYLVAPEQLEGWQARPVAETVARLVPELEAESDLVIVLGHLGEDEERVLLDVPGVDLVVSGHSHRGLEKPLRDEDTLIVRVRAFGHEIGRLDLEVDVERDAITDWSWEPVAVRSSAVEPDPATRKVVDAWETKVSELVDYRVATVGHDYDRDEMRRLFERALREEAGADIAFMNTGGIRDVFLEGELLARGVWNAMPFEDYIVTGTVRGSQLPRSVRRERRLDAEQTYRFATIDFVVAQWRVRGEADFEVEHGELFRDLLLRWIEAQGRLD